MAFHRSFSVQFAMLLLTCLGVSVAQAPRLQTNTGDLTEAAPASRLAGDWRSPALVSIPSSMPHISPAADEGAAPAGARLDRMLLLLAPSPAQQQALTTELANLQNSASPQYHRWVTPSDFADAYENSAGDVAAVAAWLQSEGFEVAPLPAGRGWIEFSGTVAQVEQAFQTQIHMVAAAGGERAVLAGGISLPAALRPLVLGLVSLDGALSTPAITTPLSVAVSSAELAAENSAGLAEALTPKLLGQLIDLNTTQPGAADGTGETIAIAARSNVIRMDIAAFREAFGLQTSPIKVVLNGRDPGLADDQAAATLAASWAGAAAPGAQIVLVPAAPTSATDGLDLSLAAIVDQDLAHTVAVGYSACEAGLSQAHQAFYAALYRQAAAEGIAVIAAAGDSGASACYAAGGNAPVSGGYGVNALASTPWNTAVGVAAFGDTGPEAGRSSLAAWSPASAADPAYASGGGRSEVYALPEWQAELAQSAVATPTARMLPDLALPTAVDASTNPGLAFCLSGTAASGDSAGGCALVRSGGSSAAAAIFAGIAARAAEEYGAQGNVAPRLYALGGQSGIFNDVLAGNALLRCEAGSPGCGSEGQIGFVAEAGFDLATGLGVPDAKALLSHFAKPQVTGNGLANVTNDIIPGQTINPSGSIILSALVASGTGGPAPTGTVAFFDQSTSTNVATVSLVANGGETATAAMILTGVLTQGGHPIEANYSGDTVYAAASSLPVVVEVEPTATTTVVTPASLTPAPGSLDTVTATITALDAGIGAQPPSGTVNFLLDGVSQGIVPVVSGSPSTASIKITVPTTVGNHPITGFYSGDSNYISSTSAAVTITVPTPATVTTLTATPPVPATGVAETLTATIAPLNTGTSPTNAITGTVNFYDGTTLLGMATVASNAASLTGVMLATNVAHSLTAVYSGDVNWQTSTSTALAIPAVPAPVTVVLAPNLSVVPPGQTQILTATVTPNSTPVASAEQNPTGNVIFYDGTTVIGEATLVAASAGDSATATLSTQTQPGGQDTFTAVYQGDLAYATATSNLLSLDVEAFTITPAPSNPTGSINILQGSAGSASFIIAGLGGFNGEIQVICTVPAQDNMACTTSPQEVVPTATVTFAVQTTTGNAAAIKNDLRRLFWPRAASGTALAVLGFFLLPIGIRARMFRHKWMHKSGAKSSYQSACNSARRFLILLLLLAGLGGAGIGCNNVSTLNSSATPLGVATLKITASAFVNNASVSQSVYLNVNVLAAGEPVP